MKKTNLTTLKSYCPYAKVWNVEDMIKYHVDLEDKYNHPHKKIEIPKLTYYKSVKFRKAPLHAFLSAILPW